MLRLKAAATARRSCPQPPCLSPPSCGSAPRPQREHEPPSSSAAPPSDDRSHSIPNCSLWRRVAGTLGQVLACLAYRHAHPAGGGADVGDGREQGVLPEVVGLPPADLIKQVRVGPAMEGCCRQHCVLELLVLPTAA